MSGLVFEKLTQALAANQAVRLAIGGDFFRLSESDWPLTVRIIRAERVIGTMANWQAGDYLRGVEFDAVEVVNGATAQNVTVQIAGGGVGSDRVVGEVSVIDGGGTVSKSGSAFFGYFAQAAVAGQYTMGQLWNPAGSGRRAVLKECRASSNVATTFCLQTHNAALAFGAASPRNKMPSSAVVSAMEVRAGAQAAWPGANLFVEFGAASMPTRLKFTEPVVIEPGQGVIFGGNVVNVAVYGSFQFFEEGI